MKGLRAMDQMLVYARELGMRPSARGTTRLRAQNLPLEMVQLLFLPEVGKVQAVVEALGTWAKEEGVRYAPRQADFDRCLESLVRTKEAEGIVNSATAVLKMVEIVEEYLAATTTTTA